MTLLFTLTSLLIFSLFSNGALESYLQQKTSLLAYKSSYQVRQKAQDDKERLKFIENKPAQIEVEKKINPVTPSKNSESTEDKDPPPTKGWHFKESLNLYTLLEGTTDYKKEEEIFLKLFDHLYHQTTFYTPTLGKELLEALRKRATGRKNEKDKKKTVYQAEDLASVDLEDPLLQEKLYKVLKGSEVEGHSGGYPSLCDFLIVHKNKSLINLYLARYELIEVLYDAETAQYIMDHRKEWKKRSGETEPNHGTQILKDIANYFGREPKYKDQVIFRIR